MTEMKRRNLFPDAVAASIARPELKVPSSQEIRKLKERAIETTSDGVALLDSESRYYYLNDAHVKPFGYAHASELIGQTWKYIYPEHEIARIERDIFPLLMANGTWTGETVGKRKDGSLTQQNISLTILEDGGMICITRILDHEKEIERELRIRGKKMRFIVDQMTEGILLENADRVVQAVNAQLGNMFGVPMNPADMIDTDCAAGLEFVKTLTADPKGFMISVNERLREKKPFLNEKIELVSGKILERDFIPIYSEGVLEGYLWTYRDVTQSELSKRGLEELIVREKELNDTRSKLVRTISHEFKKPLLNTLEGVNMLRTLLTSHGVDESYGRNLDYLVNELERLNRNVNRLVTYESLYDPRQLNLRCVRARNLMSNYLNYNYKMFVVSEKFHISDSFEEELLSLDMNLFDLGLKNVLDNAIKYSTSNAVITIDASMVNGAACFTFSNPIPQGLTPDAKLLGTPLYRVNPEDDKGLGLGLGIVKNIINLHHGTVEFSTGNGKFIVTIKLITTTE